ncbi:hypothetical protein GGR39_001404 [Novosphingobium fluoreni]|uniref:Uncharacterized protein n=1 Tax=Novosphingobium fluoreni TaxID=1391222 RepID=A0A7W6FXV5_9SPHN|nr:hypothetical protein [Novosphingobium fluoreni]MBB3939764.1 hypothetical protein [Novosphingobium fluoreni]
MPTVTETDRRAAEDLRAHLADLTGFWHAPGDLSPICLALAAHREMAEAAAVATLPRADVVSMAQAKLDRKLLAYLPGPMIEKRATG